MAEKKERLLKKALKLPVKSGSYLMKKSDGQVMYIGKAKSLRSRVSSYFRNTTKDLKTELLVKKIDDFEFIVTSNEAEAFILENNLIKHYRPMYNIRLKDDRSYPYIIVDLSEDYPRLQYVRNIKNSKNIESFGPFVIGSNISSIIRILTKSFGLRDCSMREFVSRKRPCLLFQIGHCMAPCVENINKEEYKVNLLRVLDVFRGNGEKTINELERRMYFHAEKEEFELASMIRDNLFLLKDFLNTTTQKNIELNEKEKNVDIISYFKGKDDEIDISIFLIRNGLLLGNKNFHYSAHLNSLEYVEQSVVGFLYQYYSMMNEKWPSVIVLPFDETNYSYFKVALIKLIAKREKKEKIEVRSPGRKFLSLHNLVNEQVKEIQKHRKDDTDYLYKGSLKLSELLNLFEIPRILECFDIAIWQGSSPTASKIVFIDGKADKTLYRHYKLKELSEKNNDFAMMKEIISRRIKHGNFPDVFIVDGGVGQVKQFTEVLKENKIFIPVVGIIKSKIKSKSMGFKESVVQKTDELLVIPKRKNHYVLKKCMPLLRILVQMRDEAHRFSRILHHKHEKRRIMNSFFDDIKGIGPITRTKIQKNLDVGIDELKKMTNEEIRNKLKVSKKIADKLLEKFKK